MKLTKKQIMDGSSNNGGWSKPQLAILGVEWPPQQGWMFGACCREITPEQYQEFLKLRGAKTKRMKRAALNPELF
jgi:hypothetical protein